MWRDGGNFDVRDLGNNTAMLIFDDEDDPQWILMQRPWSFDKYLGHLVNVRDSQTQWISFKYECMPNFCYWCGVTNHDEKDCRMWVSSQGTL
ncbi:hypothetical protein CFP56_027770 [Quercus suber]|uniref:Zinc knuckle CX2CX4HX4C domain-containing protein n=1 Tax=Quercus suber TaxID=58331 RepID=A0AAW0LVS0_QUESU